MKLSVILGSTRPERLGERVGKWVLQQAPGAELSPQVLAKTPRNGFTAVEWGGLLLGQ